MLPSNTPPPSCDRRRALKKLGLSEEDVRISEGLFSQIQLVDDSATKAERLLGYNSTRLKRAKALRLLGATEDDVELENAKTLGSLGHSGRRRSFVVRNGERRLAVLIPTTNTSHNVRSRSIFALPRKSRAAKANDLGRDRLKSLPHGRRHRGSSSSLSSPSNTYSRRFTS